MNPKNLLLLAASLCIQLLAVNSAQAQGTTITYQGRMYDGGAPANGSYDLTFSLFTVSAGGAAVAGPLTNSPVAISNGLFTVKLDFGTGVFGGSAYWLQIGTRTNGGGAFTDLAPRQELTPTPYAIFAEAAPVADNAVTGAKIVDGTITSLDLAPNSVNSGHVIDGQVFTADLANDAVNSAKVLNGSLVGADLGNNTVTSVQLADSVGLGDAAIAGQLDIYKTTLGGPAISLIGTGTGGYGYFYQNDGQFGVYLDGDSSGAGLIQIYAADQSVGVTLDGDSGGAGLVSVLNTNGSTRVSVDGAGNESGGQITVYAQDGSSTVQLWGESTGAGLIRVNNNVSQNRVLIDGEGNGAGGQITLFAADGGAGIDLFGDSGGAGLQYLYAADGAIGISLDGDSGGAGLISVRNTNASSRVILDGFSSNGGGEISVYDTSGSESIELLGAYSGTLGGRISAKQADGTVGVEIYSESYAGDGGLVSVKNAAGAEKIEFDGDDGDGAPAIRLKNAAGTTTITLDGDVSGDGRITTQELTITGGSDLSEQFDINQVNAALQPGMVVCIDPQHPGELVASTKAYDRTVAGIISGAGGVKPGMMMGQVGTKADGKYPVALTGRVYVLADASKGTIYPGDLLTTSSTPGHAMKVGNHNKAQGAILGKAMTGLSGGSKGMVLILVSLQ